MDKPAEVTKPKEENSGSPSSFQISLEIAGNKRFANQKKRSSLQTL